MEHIRDILSFTKTFLFETRSLPLGEFRRVKLHATHQPGWFLSAVDKSNIRLTKILKAKLAFLAYSPYLCRPN